MTLPSKKRWAFDDYNDGTDEVVSFEEESARWLHSDDGYTIDSENDDDNDESDDNDKSDDQFFDDAFDYLISYSL